MPEIQDPLLFSKLNLETAIIDWTELQRFFAQGKVLFIDKNTDLVSTAESIASDQSDQVSKLIQKHTINLVSDEQAKQWIESNSQVWAVVVAPWVLVQEAD